MRLNQRWDSGGWRLLAVGCLCVLAGAAQALDEEPSEKVVEIEASSTNAVAKSVGKIADNTLKIEAPIAYYDKKEGFVSFRGGVSFQDEQYQLHANRAYVFTDASNSVKRVVALENVAITNGTKRAYGIKAAYYRQTGMVVLYGDESTPAVVRDEARNENQEVVGEKIKFWTNSHQIEVLKARIKAPVKGGGELKKNILGN